MSKFSAIALDVGKIVVFQGDGEFAEVQGTRMCRRDLDDSPTATQWRNELNTMLAVRNEEIEQELAGNQYCGCAEHKPEYRGESRWIPISRFSVNKRTGKTRTWCKKCCAAYERNRYADSIEETEGRPVRAYNRAT